MAAALNIVGTVVGFIGQRKAAKAAKKADRLRERQMNLEAMRKKRELIREGIVARATAVSNATNQGAGEGSGLAGGLAQITGAQNRNTTAVSQDLSIGGGIFSANRQAAKGDALVSLGSGISSIGNSIGNMMSRAG